MKKVMVLICLLLSVVLLASCSGKTAVAEPDDAM